MSDEVENPIALARVTLSSEFGAPRRPCAAAGCDQLARRLYCSETCREREKKRRARAEMPADLPSPIIRVSLSASFTIGPSIGEWAFADDTNRFVQMGVIGPNSRRKRRAITPRIDPADPNAA